MLCARCGKALTPEMEIEYSRHLGEYFCSPDCATDRYYEYLDSEPVQFGHWESVKASRSTLHAADGADALDLSRPLDGYRVDDFGQVVPIPPHR